MSAYPKHLKVIACESMTRAIQHFAPLSPHTLDIGMNRIGLHDSPAALRETIQNEIDQTQANLYDAIVLVYGLCGRALDGIKSHHTPIVLTRAHDCITLLLGSRQTYQEAQLENPGTYWLSQDFLERSDDQQDGITLGAGFQDDLQSLYDTYEKKYGEENAGFLIQTMQSWQNHYNRVVLLENELGISPDIRIKAEMEASKRGLQLDSKQGNLNLVKKLLFGEWDDDFLLIPPGSQLTMTYDQDIISTIKFEPTPK